MKHPNLLLKKLPVFLLLLLLLQSCNEKAGSWKNDKIEKGKREDFHALNTMVLKNLKANNPKDLQSKFCKELIGDNHIDHLVELISNRLTDDKYTLLDEYYVVNNFKDADTVKAAGTDINSYNLYYAGTAKEMYMAFFTPKASKNTYLLSIIYAKYDYGWKISTLDLAPYTINGKTGPELFKLAKEQYEKHYLIDAVDNISLALICFKPSNIWQYNGENDLSELNVKVIDEANKQYKFPFTLNLVPTKPKIIRIYNETNSNGSYPMIYYLSKVNLKDTIAVKKENEQIKKIIGRVMPGIDKDKKYVLYTAFNVRPTGMKTVDHFDMIDKLTK